MTREEAIKILQGAIKKPNTEDGYLGQALDMAIKALKKEPCEECISRQAMLDAMYELCDTGETLIENPWRDNPHIDAITDAINDLLPVTPQENERNCATCEYSKDNHNAGTEECHLCMWESQYKPKTGHWIIVDDCEKFIAKCSECGRIEDSRMIHKYPYCHCGTKMDSEVEQ